MDGHQIFIAVYGARVATLVVGQGDSLVIGAAGRITPILNRQAIDLSEIAHTVEIEDPVFS